MTWSTTQRNHFIVEGSESENQCCNLLFTVCLQRNHRRKSSDVGRDGCRVHEWRPSHGGRLVCQSQRERQIWQVSGSLTNHVRSHSTWHNPFFPPLPPFFILLLVRLQVIADRLVEHFVSAGLMVREWDRVKLHATVMNTLFRKDATGKEGRYTEAARRATGNEAVDLLRRHW